MVFSPAGTAAALYDSGAGRVQILTGLPDAATVQGDVDISALARAHGFQSGGRRGRTL